MAPQFRLRETCLNSASLSIRTFGGRDPGRPPPQPSEGEPAPNLAETGQEQKRPGTLAPGRSRKKLMSGVPAGVCLAPWAGCVRERGSCGSRKLRPGIGRPKFLGQLADKMAPLEAMRC